MRSWNARFRGLLSEIAEQHRMREPVVLDDLAEMLSCVIDGGIIMSRTLGDPSRLARQVLAYRGFVKLLFAPERAH